MMNLSIPLAYGCHKHTLPSSSTYQKRVIGTRGPATSAACRELGLGNDVVVSSVHVAQVLRDLLVGESRAIGAAVCGVGEPGDLHTASGAAADLLIELCGSAGEDGGKSRSTDEGDGAHDECIVLVG